MTDITDTDLVRRHLDLRAFFERRAAEVKAELAPWQAMQTLIEGEMMRRLNERKAQNSATDEGTFFKVSGTSVRVKDKVAFLDHVFTQRMQGLPDAYDMLTQALAKDSVIAFMDANGGKTPPGVEAEHYTKVQVRKG